MELSRFVSRLIVPVQRSFTDRIENNFMRHKKAPNTSLATCNGFLTTIQKLKLRIFFFEQWKIFDELWWCVSQEVLITKISFVNQIEDNLLL